MHTTLVNQPPSPAAAPTFTGEVGTLARCDLFRHVTPERLQRLETISPARSFARNNSIYLPGEPAEEVFLLVSGRVKICHLTPEGKQSILAFIEPHELFGESAIFEFGPREEYAEAIEPSTVLKIPSREIRSLIRQQPDVSWSITRMIGLRRRRIERRLKNLLFLSNRDRLCHLLLELAERHGVAGPEGTRLQINLSHQNLANVIGSTRETVTVILGELQAEGLLHLGRRKIVLLQPQRLAEDRQ